MSVTYQICRALRLFKGKLRPYTTAIILAGGVGNRMKTADGVTKQMLLLDGIPVLVRSVMAFDASEYIDEIVVVTRKEERETVLSLMAQYGIKKFSKAVEGGSVRSESARLGLESVSDKTKFVAIHDAARCLITPAMIADVTAAAYANRAATAGTASVDTLKRIDKNGYVTETLDRSVVYKAQTPQIFEINLYRAAVYSAKDGDGCTDDNMLVEALGQAVKMVDVGEENLKITTPLDMDIASAVLKRRAGS